MRMKMRKNEKEEERLSEWASVLPKLIIFKFQRMTLIWFRFLNQFESVIDKQDFYKFFISKRVFVSWSPQLNRSPHIYIRGYARVNLVLLANHGKLESSQMHN